MWGQFVNNCFKEMCSGSKASSYFILRRGRMGEEATRKEDDLKREHSRFRYPNLKTQGPKSESHHQKPASRDLGIDFG